jgi:PAS domain S-box-containing protein
MASALHESEERYRLAARATNDVIWDWDIATDIQEWAEALESVFGFRPHEVGVDNGWWGTRLHPDDRNRVRRELDAVLVSDAPVWSTEYRFRRADDSYALVADRGIILRDERGQAIRMIGAMADITEQRRSREEIERLNAELEQRVVERTAQLASVNRELEAFSYSVSHDLRAPLRALDGFSMALLEDCHEALNDEGRYYLQRMRLATQRMGQLIDDLLKLSRVTREEMTRQRVDLTALARSVLSDLQEYEPERQVTVDIEDGLAAEGDPRLLRTALSNLLGNAWKFTSKTPKAQITFGKTTVNGEITFYVRDNGVGFDMAYADKLFSAFQRLHSQTEFEGTGVGLATVQRVIHRHGGRVWADSAVDRGTTFYFTL